MDAIANLPEGLYEVDSAYLVAPNQRRLPLSRTVFEIFIDRKGAKVFRGRCFIRNLAFVEMLEECEVVDLGLQFFQDYFLWLEEPVIQAGKVFEPETESSMLFSVGKSISRIDRQQFLRRCGLAAEEL